MIVVDIESSGLNMAKCGVWQIGALDMGTGQEFIEEARIDDEDEVIEEALRVIGKTEKELRDKKKQSQKQLIEHFFSWLKRFDERLIAGDNVGFDIYFIQNKCLKYGIQEKFLDAMGYKGFDLPTLAQIKYREKFGKLKVKEGVNDMGLKNILEFCGMKDERTQLNKGKVVKEGKAHNALEDCRLEAECFSRLLSGKSLFPEYSKFPIPENLRSKK